jgi:N-acetylglucosaminyldiphosphoundecaprenol N-acetyl-beta-D-mannosaminyltransferase
VDVRRVRLLNGQFDGLTLPQAIEVLFERLASGARGWLCTVNVAYLMMMRADARLQRFVERAALVVADGQPLIWCSRWFRRPLPERVPGIDLVIPVSERAAREGRRVFLLGATAQVVAEVARRLRERIPGLQIDYADGYFSPAEAAERAERIRASGAEILFVGMGVPRQENFIEEQWERLGVRLAIGVGGSLDVLAGLRRRAPGWVQAIGMEWLFRLAQEPRRLFARYLVTNCRFVWLVLLAMLLPDESALADEAAEEEARSK